MLLQTGTHTTHKARADFWTLIFEFKFTEALYSLQLFDSEELHMFYCEVSRRAATKSQTFHDWLVERLILKTGVMVISMAGAADNSLEALTEQVRPGLGVLAAFMDTESAKGFFSKLVRDRIAASDTLAKCAVVQLAREGVDDEQLRSLAPRRCLGARMGPESATPYGYQARPHLDPQMRVVLNIFGTPPRGKPIFSAHTAPEIQASAGSPSHQDNRVKRCPCLWCVVQGVASCIVGARPPTIKNAFVAGVSRHRTLLGAKRIPGTGMQHVCGLHKCSARFG